MFLDNHTHRARRTPALLLRCARLSVCACLSLGVSMAVAAKDPVPTAHSLPLEELRAFAEVFGKIKSEYVDSVDDATLLRGAIRGMLSSLDPHSEFLAGEDYSNMREYTEGKFGGLGLEVTTEQGFLKVVAPLDDTPAFDAGLKPGDVIVKLDDVPIKDKNLRAAVEQMRGRPGTPITLSIARQGEKQTFDITLIRAVIRVPSVRGDILDEGLSYIRISNFQSRTAKNLVDKIEQLQAENGGQLRGLVLDLRNNPGGILTSAVQVSDLFLSAGDIVSTRGRDQIEQHSYSAKPDDILAAAPIVVLVNGGTASASEIVAGALQDNARATILGTKTFGKGSVQSIFPLTSGAALKMTTAKYYTPSARSIQATGIRPDIVVQPTEYAATAAQRLTPAARLELDDQLRRAVKVLKGMAVRRHAKARQAARG